MVLYVYVLCVADFPNTLWYRIIDLAWSALSIVFALLGDAASRTCSCRTEELDKKMSAPRCGRLLILWEP